MKPRIIFLVGPTAIGKTEIAVAIAKKIDAEIISCDSMQIYKGMDIITSKPPLALREIVRHHLISAVSADKEYNVSKYYKDAARKLKEILKRGKVPLIVGGTGLYMSILIDGIFKSNASNKVIRNRLYRQAEGLGNEYLYNRLKDIDLEAAAKIHPHDTRRIVRALEVFQTSGEPISKLQKQRKGLSQDYNIKIFSLNMPREKIYQRIEERVEKMFSKGLVGEVKRLLKSKLSKTATYAIGIKELKGYLDGLYDLEEAKLLIKRNTRLYAKRQLTWFRKDKRINWIEVGEKEKPAAIANKILRKLKNLRTVS
ncbi:MAG: tRNA (adenosine(37)-N6)-dimethylallyltransferase MiaA [Candidatus Omnitrophica bacterium CG23_combo_of_CG06-09_8_20_14_all_40_11]|nr:MAG: tRNA (adenosine(37)-N6)-dimethylallyltransferase MiaA [Candidatus Omnitrophica bacterium CG23_combo_of_CG06-09_8_20_14_all_40_11]